MKRSFIVMIIALCNGSTWAMQDKDPNIAITQWEDAEQFAGHLVAYTTTSYFFGATKGFAVSSGNNQLKYGYVSKKVDAHYIQTGHQLFQILKSDETDVPSILIEIFLKKAKMFMRHTNALEKVAILKALKDKTICVPYPLSNGVIIDTLTHDKEVRSLLEKPKN